MSRGQASIAGPAPVQRQRSAIVSSTNVPRRRELFLQPDSASDIQLAIALGHGRRPSGSTVKGVPVKAANANVAIEDTGQHAVALARDSDKLRQHRLDRQRFLELSRAPDSVRGQVRTSWRRSVLSGVVLFYNVLALAIAL